MRIYTVNHDFFRPPWGEVQSYIAGFAAADGCVTDRNLTFCLARCDSGHLSKIAGAMGYNGPVRNTSSSRLKTTGKRYPQACLSIYSKQLIAGLVAMGITPRKSFTLEAWRGPPKLMRAWWRGLFDGDGTWGLRKPRADYPGHRYWQARLIGSHATIVAFDEYVSALAGKHTHITPHHISEGISTANISDIRSVRALAADMYCGATIWLDRKKLQADAVLSLPEIPDRRTIYTRRDVAEKFGVTAKVLQLREAKGLVIPGRLTFQCSTLSGRSRTAGYRRTDVDRWFASRAPECVRWLDMLEGFCDD